MAERSLSLEVPMRKQYHFSADGEGGLDAWDVHRLVELAQRLPVRSIPIPDTEVDTVYWFDHDKNQPTVRSIIEHMKLIEATDLGYPIILGADGRVMDGMHRVAKAILDGRMRIKAVRFEIDPEPDYRKCDPADLPYD